MYKTYQHWLQQYEIKKQLNRRICSVRLNCYSESVFRGSSKFILINNRVNFLFQINVTKPATANIFVPINTHDWMLASTIIVISL